MTKALLALATGVLVACAGGPPASAPTDVFQDALFAAPSTVIDPDDALAMSGPMREYLHARILGGPRFGDRRRQLVDALYSKGELRLEYDASETRTAAQAFEARAGNCLALVLMTSSFAKEMGLAVRYQLAIDEETWDHSGDTFISQLHVNLSLDDRPPPTGVSYVHSEPLVVDFLPSKNAQRLRTRVVQERTVVAMYLNNRAVESLLVGRFDDAYWWARQAVRQDPSLSSAYITLAVVYRSTGHPELAEPVLSRVLEREPRNTKAISNRILALRDLGRSAEAEAWVGRLQELDPNPPFSYFHRGVAAFREHRFDEARDLFGIEVRRAPYHHEFEFWLALTYFELHDVKQATWHLTKAREASTTRKDHDRYSLKLERLKALVP